MLKSLSAALVAASLLAGCATVTLRPQGGAKIAGAPDYQESKPYFFWGLSKEHTIDVQAVCGDKGVEQVQSQFTPGNVALGVVTLGIYSPKTASVWCGLEGGSK